MPPDGWFERELMVISQTVSDKAERREKIAALNDRRDRERMNELLESLDLTSDRLDAIAGALEADQDSGTRTREEMDQLRDEIARLTLAMTARRELEASGEHAEALPAGAVEVIPDLRPVVPGSVPGWVVKALLVLLALSLAVVGGVVGLRIVGPWSSFSVEPGSSDSGEASSTVSPPVEEEDGEIVWP